MQIKTIVVLSIFNLNFCFSILGFSQNKEKNKNDSIAKMVMQPDSIKNKSYKTVGDNNQSDKNKKDSVDKVKNINKEELEIEVTESLIQNIIIKNSEELKNYEEVIYDEEHISYFLFDTIQANLLRVNNSLNARANSLDAVLNKFGSLYSDTTNRSRIKKSTLEQLRDIILVEDKEKDSLIVFQNLQKEKIKELASTKKVLEKLQNSLKPNFDSINKIIKNINIH